MNYMDLGIFFINNFDLANFFKTEISSYKEDLVLLDSSVYGFEIKASRIDFEFEIKFSKIFHELFFVKKLSPEILNEFLDNDSDIPF